MAVTFRDYSGDLVEAAHSVLLELVRLLGEYRDDLVVVGGWVPQLILPDEPLKHVGSIDVDLAFNHRNLQDAGYATIQKLLLSRGYEQDHRQPFIFHRTVNVGGNPIKVQVDFLAGEYASVATLKPAMRGHLKTGQRSWVRTRVFIARRRGSGKEFSTGVGYISR